MRESIATIEYEVKGGIETNMSEIRVLHVVGQLNLGGAESRIMDLYRNIDREKVQFDFVVHTPAHCYFEDEAKSLGANIYRIPRFRVYNYFSYKRAWKKFFEAHMLTDDESKANTQAQTQAEGSVSKSEFAVVQGHMTSTASIYLPIAKAAGVKTTVAHARSAGVDKGLKGKITKFMRKNLADRADFLFTCSDFASKAVFGEKAMKEKKIAFIPNAIDTDKYIFDEKVRNEMRKKLGIEDKLVLGHVGRFHYAKNHEYLLKVFKEIVKLCDESKMTSNAAGGENTEMQNGKLCGSKSPVLIMLGDGPRMDEMQALAKNMGISENVKFLGSQADIEKYYPAMDCFLYPSRYEGLPGTVIEAQASGLPVLMSSEICPECVITDLVKTLGIDIDPKEWAKAALKEVGVKIESDTGVINTADGSTADAGETKNDNAADAGKTPTSSVTDAGNKTDGFMSFGNEDDLKQIDVFREAFAGKVAIAGFNVKAQAKQMQAFYEMASQVGENNAF